MDLNPAQLLEAMRPGDWSGLYIVGCFDKRVTFLTQQVRGLNLVRALFQHGDIVPGHRVGVIGGGAAGITSAVAAALIGSQVTLFEAADDLMAIQERSRRFLHPNLYDWPATGSSERDAGLPILNWRANHAEDVVRDLRKQLREFTTSRPCSLDIRRNTPVDPDIAQISKEPGALKVRVTTNEGANTEDFHVVIIAIGFGVDVPVHVHLTPSYWVGDGLDNTYRARGNRKLLVSGAGDGGLIDLARTALVDFDQQEYFEKITTQPEFIDLGTHFAEIDLAARRRQETGERINLYDLYERSITLPPAILDELKSRKRARSALFFNHSFGVFTLEAALINRMLAYLIVKAGIAERIHGHITEASALSTGGWLVTFNGGATRQEQYDVVIARHGPDPRHFPRLFPQLKQAGTDLGGKLAILDLTRTLSQETFRFFSELVVGTGNATGSRKPLEGPKTGQKTQTASDGAPTTVRSPRLEEIRPSAMPISSPRIDFERARRELVAYFEHPPSLNLTDLPSDLLARSFPRIRSRRLQATGLDRTPTTRNPLQKLFDASTRKFSYDKTSSYEWSTYFRFPLDKIEKQSTEKSDRRKWSYEIISSNSPALPIETAPINLSPARVKSWLISDFLPATTARSSTPFVAFAIGEPGSGKSTLFKYIVNTYRSDLSQRHVVVSRFEALKFRRRCETLRTDRDLEVALTDYLSMILLRDLLLTVAYRANTGGTLERLPTGDFASDANLDRLLEEVQTGPAQSRANSSDGRYDAFVNLAGALEKNWVNHRALERVPYAYRRAIVEFFAPRYEYCIIFDGLDHFTVEDSVFDYTNDTILHLLVNSFALYGSECLTMKVSFPILFHSIFVLRRSTHARLLDQANSEQQLPKIKTFEIAPIDPQVIICNAISLGIHRAIEKGDLPASLNHRELMLRARINISVDMALRYIDISFNLRISTW